MKSAEMKVIHFSERDVIATSTYLMSGLWDGQAGNATFTRSSDQANVWSTYLNDSYHFVDSKGTNQDGGLVAGKDGTDLESQVKAILDGGGSITSTFNGSYTYDSSTSTFTQIKQ